jgi:hypothetical protein
MITAYLEASKLILGRKKAFLGCQGIGKAEDIAVDKASTTADENCV